MYLTEKTQSTDFPDAPASSARKGAWLLAKAILSLVVLGAGLARLNFPNLRASILHVDPGLLGAAIITLAASIAVAALRWSRLSRSMSPIGPREAISITFAAQFAGQALPSSVGQDAVRAWLALRSGRPAAPVVSIILLDRLCGLIGLSALIGIGLPRLSVLDAAHGRAAALIAGCLAGAALSTVFLPRLAAPAWVGERIGKVWRAAGEASRLITTATGAVAILLSAAVQALVVLSALLIAQAIGQDLSLYDGFATIPAAMLIAMLPISLNGWGVRESAMIVSLGFASVAPAQAFLISVLFGVCLLAASLPGAFALILLRRRP